MKPYLLLCSATVFLIGCSRLDDQLLVGKWRAVAVTEEGFPLDIDLSMVAFEFFSSGHYAFNSTVGYREAGTYYLDGNLLYTTDTLNTASAQKVVAVVTLTQDSLVLNMMVNEKPKVMKLKKVDN